MSDAPSPLNDRAASSSAPATRAAWQRHLRAPGTPAALPDIRQAVVEAAEECGFDMEDVIKLEMAVGEACTNIIEHAYATQPLKLELEVQILRFANRMEVVIQDYSSINFSLGENQSFGEIDEWFAAGRKRGLGIFIIQSFVDKVDHRFICGQGNELKLTKFFA